MCVGIIRILVMQCLIAPHGFPKPRALVGSRFVLGESQRRDLKVIHLLSSDMTAFISASRGTQHWHVCQIFWRLRAVALPFLKCVSTDTTVSVLGRSPPTIFRRIEDGSCPCFTHSTPYLILTYLSDVSEREGPLFCPSPSSAHKPYGADGMSAQITHRPWRGRGTVACALCAHSVSWVHIPLLMILVFPGA